MTLDRTAANPQESESSGERTATEGRLPEPTTVEDALAHALDLLESWYERDPYNVWIVEEMALLLDLQDEPAPAPR